jgi:excisionase family DNA binding protein
VDDEPLLYSIEKAAKKLSLGETKLREMIRIGQLPCVRIDRSVRISADALKAFREAHEDRFARRA